MLIAWKASEGRMLYTSGINTSQPDGPPQSEYLAIRTAVGNANGGVGYGPIRLGIINDLDYPTIVQAIMDAGSVYPDPDGSPGSPDGDGLCVFANPAGITTHDRALGKVVVYLNSTSPAPRAPNQPAYRCELNNIETPYRIDTNSIIEFYVTMPSGSPDTVVDWVIEDGGGDYTPQTNCSSEGSTTFYGTSHDGASLCGQTTRKTAKIAMQFKRGGRYRIEAKTQSHGALVWEVHVWHFYVGSDMIGKYYSDDQGPEDHPWEVGVTEAVNKNVDILFPDGPTTYRVTIPVWSLIRNTRNTAIDDLGYLLGLATTTGTASAATLAAILPYLRTMYMDLYHETSAPF